MSDIPDFQQLPAQASGYLMYTAQVDSEAEKSSEATRQGGDGPGVNPPTYNANSGSDEQTPPGKPSAKK